MNFAGFSLKHPVPTIVIYLFLAVIGMVSLSRLQMDLYPAMEYPLAVVATQYEGAGPQEVESLVSSPLEEVLGSIGGVTNLRSVNNEGQSLVLVQFDWGTDMDQATLSIREKVDQVKGYFPDGVKAPMVFKIDPSALPVLTIALSGDVSQAELKQIADETFKPRLERLDGVASLSVMGGTEREIQVIVDPRRLQTAGLSINQVAQALRYENLNLPGGEVREGPVDLLVRSVGQFSSIDEIKELRLGPVRLGDVAEVKDTYADLTSKVWLNGQAAVGMDVQKQTGANPVSVARAVKAQLAEINKELPPGVQATVLMDQSKMVENSIRSIVDSGWQGGLLAVLVLWLFLRHFRSTLTVALAIPISVIATFFPLFLHGVTLNMLSMGGLSLGVGMMVDAAIVVLDNIYRHRQELGESLDVAAVEGTKEVTLAVSASTLTNVVVFLPVIWINGIAQQYFRELSLSVTYSLLCSMIVSFTLVPLMARALLRERKGPARPPSKLYLWLGVKLDGLNSFYGRVLDWALGHRLQVVAIGVAAMAGAVAVYFGLGFEFMPKLDTGEFRVEVRMPPGTRMTETEKAVQAAAKVVQALPEAQKTYAAVGSSGEVFATSGGPNQGYVVGMLAPRTARKRSLNEIMESVRTAIQIPDARVTVSMSGFLDPGGVPVEVMIKGEDQGVLQQLADEVGRQIEQVPGTREIDTSVADALPEVQVKVDRARAAAYYLSPSTIAMAVQNAVKGQDVSKYRQGGKEYDIKLQATPEARQDMAALSALPIATPAGQAVPLSAVATLIRGNGPTMVEREDQSRVVRVTSELYQRDMGSVTNDIKERLSKLPLPEGYSIEYGGEDAQFSDAIGGLTKSLLFSIALVYLVMAAQFESFFHPIVIMLTVPLSFVGAVGGLVLTGRSMDVSGMIGIIMLVGIVVNNAIVLIDFINQLRARGHSREEAIRIAGPLRLRPVLMTTLTTLLGLLPLTLAMGEGSELEAPLATVVMGGLTVSTVLTLIVIPVVYLFLDDLSQWLMRKFSARE
ncbi:MAG: efflux RND transporter permease subunit [Mycobacterium leprae]